MVEREGIVSMVCGVCFCGDKRIYVLMEEYENGDEMFYSAMLSHKNIISLLEIEGDICG